MTTQATQTPTGQPPQPVNMHMHSHFSFNAAGMSPAQLVQEAKHRGLYAMAVLDFDVLDGLEECYAAADRLGIRASCGIETRTYLPDFAGVVTNSPGEPGINYLIGMGFTHVPPPGSPPGRTLAKLRTLAQDRNRDMIRRINDAHPEIAIDYDTDVLPLTPSGNPTERHLVLAYVAKVRQEPGREEDTWARVLGLPRSETTALLQTEQNLLIKVRASLMKQGGAGYAPPEPANFPSSVEVTELILTANAIPLVAWLDGLSQGERDPGRYLDTLRAKGAAGVNIVPDRNWNIADPDLRAKKTAKLNEIVAAAEAREMPLNVGTELNNYGLPFVDDFEAGPMRPHWPAFFRGAQIIIGHTRLLRYARFSYCSPEAQAEFGDDAKAKNAFFQAVGALPPLTAADSARFGESTDESAYATFQDSARAQAWALPA